MVEFPARHVDLAVGERIEAIEHVDVTLDAALDHVAGELRLVGELRAAFQLDLPADQEPCQ